MCGSHNPNLLLIALFTQKLVSSNGGFPFQVSVRLWLGMHSPSFFSGLAFPVSQVPQALSSKAARSGDGSGASFWSSGQLDPKNHAGGLLGLPNSDTE